MTLVVKLGSSIVAADDGELRADVLDAVCEQVAALEQGGERVVMVTSGAIARGMRLLELPARPRAMDELQAASAVGQGDLFRAYEERLAGHGTRAAQVLLTAADIAARTNYLNARQTLRRLIEWGVVPVVNENDTTATDEITFGDNDFLAAQVAILLDARLLVLLTDIDGLYTRRPARRPRGRADRGGRRTSPSWTAARDRRPHLGLRLRRDAQQGRRRGDGERGRHPGGDLQRDDAPARSPRPPAGEPVGTRFAARPARPPASSSGSSTRSRPTGACAVDEGAARVLRERGSQPAAGRDHRGRGRASRPATRSRSSATASVVGKGIANYSAARARAG